MKSLEEIIRTSTKRFITVDNQIEETPQKSLNQGYEEPESANNLSYSEKGYASARKVIEEDSLERKFGKAVVTSVDGLKMTGNAVKAALKPVMVPIKLLNRLGDYLHEIEKSGRTKGTRANYVMGGFVAGFSSGLGSLLIVPGCVSLFYDKGEFEGTAVLMSLFLPPFVGGVFGTGVGYLRYLYMQYYKNNTCKR